MSSIHSVYGYDSLSREVAGREDATENKPKDPDRTVVDVTDGVCSICRNITTARLRRGYQHYSSYQCLRSSQAQGCKLCLLIWKVVTSEDIGLDARQASPSTSSPFTLREVPKDHGQVRIEVRWRNWYGGTWTAFIELEVSPDTPDKAFPHWQRFQDTSLPTSFENAARLLKYCHQEHSKPIEQESILPTRVIYVGTSIQAPHVMATNGARGKWVALSYCWGSAQTVLLKIDNQANLEQKIDIALLPKTIGDAILATRQLGISFLWIDALCILQDSNTDWSTESGHMSWYYGNAWATIAAIDALNADNGFFKSREFVSPPCRLAYEMDSTDKTMGEVILFAQRSRTSIPILYHRGWTLQERLLSPRVILWSTSSLGVECQGEEQSATPIKSDRTSLNHRLPNMLLNFPRPNTQAHMSWDNLVVIPRKTYSKAIELSDDKSTTTLSLCWIDILIEYLARDLTYWHDSLPALSAIAERFQKLTGDVYLAGLWRNRIEYHLSWFTEPETIFSTPISAKVSYPTWTWASMHGGRRVKYIYQLFNLQYGRESPNFELLRWDINLKDGHEFGQVTTGILYIRCCLVSTTLFSIFHHGTFSFHHFDKSFPIQQGLEIYLDATPVSTGNLSDYLQNEPHLEAQDVVFLPLTDLSGLILELVSQEDPFRFRRIGLATNKVLAGKGMDTSVFDAFPTHEITLV